MNNTSTTQSAVALLTSTWDTLTSAQNRLHAVRDKEHANYDGGDAGHQWDAGLVRRHAVNYAVAVAAAREVGLAGPLLDVGAGAGAFSVWAATVLDRDLVLVDRDPGHRELAARAFPHVGVHAEVSNVAAAPVVFSMEVIEHVVPVAHVAFVTGLASAVLPGGLLAMSTPDESGYWRGWSGYAPHVGTLDATRLVALLGRVLDGWDVQVLRVGGPGFEVSRVGRLGVPVANRVWTSLDSWLPRLTHEAAHAVSLLGRRRSAPEPPDPEQFVVEPATRGAGTGLVAIARRPA
jgi:2-polyprenyl-3-methyl-5-hydroxy-6-metoxy-1,4-benzoquinol methylase